MNVVGAAATPDFKTLYRAPLILAEERIAISKALQKETQEETEAAYGVSTGAGGAGRAPADMKFGGPSMMGSTGFLGMEWSKWGIAAAVLGALYIAKKKKVF